MILRNSIIFSMLSIALSLSTIKAETAAVTVPAHVTIQISPEAFTPKALISPEFYTGLTLTLASYTLGHVGKNDGVLLVIGMVVDMARLYQVCVSPELVSYACGSVCAVVIAKSLLR